MKYYEYLEQSMKMVQESIAKLNESAGIERQEDHDRDSCDNCDIHNTSPETGL